MKFNVLFLMLLFFISCGGQEKTPTDTSEVAPPEDKTAVAPLGKQKACEALSLTAVAALMGVEEATIKQEDMSFGEKRSICYYYTKEGNRKFFIRMAWKSEQAQKNEVLQKQYAGYLANGEDAIKKYDELSGSAQGQILFGIGQDRENKSVHILRKRYGNEAELQLELTKEEKDETVQALLMDVLEKLN